MVAPTTQVNETFTDLIAVLLYHLVIIEIIKKNLIKAIKTLKSTKLSSYLALSMLYI